MPSEISPLLLAIDVGNSRTKFGLFEPGSAGAGDLPVCREVLAVPHEEPLPWDQLLSRVHALSPAAPRTIVATVSPPRLERMLAEWPQTGWPGPHILRGTGDLPLEIGVDAPERVGIDRLLNAVAGNRLRPARRSMILVDTGTATTIDYVSPTGAFEGGAILPGFALAARSLHHYTALLPLIEVDELSGPAPEPLGRETRAALRSGIFWGQVGAVKELVRHLAEREPDEPLVLLTGGGAPLLAPHLAPPAVWLPQLALQGLALVAESQ